MAFFSTVAKLQNVAHLSLQTFDEVGPLQMSLRSKSRLFGETTNSEAELRAFVRIRNC